MKQEINLYDLNPHTRALRQQDEAIQSLQAESQAVASQLAWYYEFDQADAVCSTERHTEQVEMLRASAESDCERLASMMRDKEELAGRIRTILNPKNWFDADQRRLRREQRELGIAIQSTRAEMSTKGLEADRIAGVVSEIEAEIQRYAQFDLSGFEQQELVLDRRLAQALHLRGTILQQKEKVDLGIAPLVEEVNQLRQRYELATRQRVEAKRLDRRLSATSNKYEKAMIHQECEREFDTGSPATVINRLGRKITSIERDQGKLIARAKKLVERMSRNIGDIVIDGNNCCYDSQGFIGLSALIAIVRELRRRWPVTLVFDASIREMLRLSDVEIRRSFPELSEVHVVATGTQADETLLGIAAERSESYILSNDRFAEYFDHNSVREQRLIRHEILRDRVLIHDLGINVAYHR